jgi:hypothetical protein
LMRVVSPLYYIARCGLVYLEPHESREGHE